MASFDALMRAPQGNPVAVRSQRDTAARVQQTPLVGLFRSALGFSSKMKCAPLMSISIYVTALHFRHPPRLASAVRVPCPPVRAPAKFKFPSSIPCTPPRRSPRGAAEPHLDGRSYDLSRDLSVARAAGDMSRTQSFLSNDALSEAPPSPSPAAGVATPQAPLFAGAPGGGEEAAGRAGLCGRAAGVPPVPRSRIAGLPMFTQQVEAGRALPSTAVLETMPSEAGSEVRCRLTFSSAMVHVSRVGGGAQGASRARAAAGRQVAVRAAAVPGGVCARREPHVARRPASHARRWRALPRRREQPAVLLRTPHAAALRRLHDRLRHGRRRGGVAALPAPDIIHPARALAVTTFGAHVRAGP